MSAFEAAKQLAALGLNVLPAKTGEKKPALGRWQQYQQQRVPETQLARWFKQDRNLWVACGAVSGVVVLDIDNDAAHQWWLARIGDAMERTAHSITAKGHHYWFRVPFDDEGEPEQIESWSTHDGALDFDVRAEGTGVIAPPSVHESGFRYEWVSGRGPERMVTLPDELRGPSWVSLGSEQPEGGEGSITSTLTALLAKKAPEGGRNDWLTRVAGHYAGWVPFEDAYLESVRLANESLDVPLDDAEVVKTAESVWKAEHAKVPLPEGAGSFEPENGWLISGGHCILTEYRVKLGDQSHEGIAPYTDFDLRVVGVVTDTEVEGHRTWEVEVVIGRTGEKRAAQLDHATVADGRKLATWLAGFGVSIAAPDGDLHGRTRETTRLLRYLESQKAPELQALHHLGYDDRAGGVVCFEGVIRHDGLHKLVGFVLPKKLRAVAPYRYGDQGSWPEAQAVLREVMSYHDETVTSVFGAYWAAGLLKGRIMQYASLWPFMALEAPSESGKSSGFFPMMYQLNGFTSTPGVWTYAALRDAMGATDFGIVPVDDMTNMDTILDLLRQGASGGSRSKKSEDRQSNETVELRASVVVSGESIPLEHEQALLDRAIRLEVPSPTGRMSLRDPTRPQWDDIVALGRRFGEDGLSQIAGHFVQRALQLQSVVEDLPGLRGGSGREQDKRAILRVGARLLAKMCEDDSHIERVDAWCAAQPATNHNSLLTDILPGILHDRMVPESPIGRQPAYVEDGRVWACAYAVAEAWKRLARTDRQRDLGSLASVRQQLKAVSVRDQRKATNKRATSHDVANHLTYDLLSLEASDVVLAVVNGLIADSE